MAEQAQITSIEAIESFRASLIVYLSQMRPVLEEASRGSLRTRFWLDSDRRQFWQQELRKRHRKLEEARLELFNAKLSQLQESSQLHLHAVQKAQAAVQEAEVKLQVIKGWEKELENRTAPLEKQIEQLHGFLATDMTQAVAHLNQIITALNAYRSTSVAGGASASGANVSTDTENAEPQIEQ